MDTTIVHRRHHGYHQRTKEKIKRKATHRKEKKNQEQQQSSDKEILIVGFAMTLYSNNIVNGDPPTLSFFFLFSFCYINNPTVLVPAPRSLPSHRNSAMSPACEEKRHQKFSKEKNRRQIDYFIIIYFLYNFHRVIYDIY